MAVRAPFTEEQMEQFKAAHAECANARREIERAERVGVNVGRYRDDLDKAEKMLATVIHEYGDDARP